MKRQQRQQQQQQQVSNAGMATKVMVTEYRKNCRGKAAKEASAAAAAAASQQWRDGHHNDSLRVQGNLQR
jgi:hypothetical protein